MRHLLLFFSLLFLQLNVLWAQTSLNFKTLSPMNVGRAGIGLSGDNNYFYVSNGFSYSSGYTTLVERYDIANNSWSQITNLLVGKRFNSSALVGNKLYVFNGLLSNGTYNDKMEVVDLSTGTVSLSTTNPYPAKSSGAAVWNGIIYVFGGSISSTAFSNALYKFDPATGVWTQLASMPEAKETSGTFVNGKLYVVGGYMGSGSSNKIDVYDIQTNTWSNLLAMPNAISGHATAPYGLKVYTAFDYTYQTYLGYYDIAANTYNVLQETNMRGRRNGGACVANGRLYIMGGDTTSSASSCLSSLQVADLNTTGFSGIQANGTIELYPNPATDVLNLLNYPKSAEFAVCDADGKILINGICTQQINLKLLPKGFYTLRLCYGEKLICERFIKE